MIWRLVASEPDIRQSLAPFWQQLAETVAWCTARADTAAPASCLRSSDLRPRLLQPSYGAAVRDVAINRRSMLKGTVRRGPEPLANGRLLVYGPDEELSDGAAESETDGYFDVNNCPPWDTWVAFFVEAPLIGRAHAAYLVSWVPSEFLESVGRGISVNPEGWIRCLEDCRDKLTRDLVATLRHGGGREA